MTNIEKLCLISCIALIIIVLSAGCVGQEKAIPTVQNSKEYFPLTGSWSYKITQGSTDALLYQVMDNEKSGIKITRSSIEFDYKVNYLNYRTKVYSKDVDGTEGAVLEITKDDLQIFKNTRYIYWIMYDDSRTYQLSYYPEGISTRAVFFLPPYGASGIMDNIFVGREERVTYMGLNSKPVECQKQACMYFVREINKGSGTYGYVDKGFVEYQWFAKDKGLVLLEQKIDGKTSMTWTLEQYNPS
jgi:hypothetical protein